ncbi:MAG: hypothetical protein JNK76_22380 [Planctomycetales bacterium]|nr:hypothetical protein [Planctomycetales bacterium]MBN8628377.1 hypothetical protein [Planctomycetota bacterium]
MTRTKIIAVVLLLAAVGGGIAGWFAFQRAKPVPFEKAAWATAEAEGRGRMVDDLLVSQRWSELDRPQVVQLLGKPDDDGPSSVRYNVGHAGGGGVPMSLSRSLTIEFDPQGRVLTAFVHD